MQHNLSTELAVAVVLRHHDHPVKRRNRPRIAEHALFIRLARTTQVIEDV